MAACRCPNVGQLAPLTYSYCPTRVTLIPSISPETFYHLRLPKTREEYCCFNNNIAVFAQIEVENGRSTECLRLNKECLMLTEEQKHKSLSSFSSQVWRIINHNYCRVTASQYLFLLQAVSKASNSQVLFGAEIYHRGRLSSVSLFLLIQYIQ